MIILSDCMTETDDEGCIKVASILAKKLKAQAPETTIICYGRKTKFSDKHLKLNCLFLNKHLHAFLRQKNESVLYIPFACNIQNRQESRLTSGCQGLRGEEMESDSLMGMEFLLE